MARGRTFGWHDATKAHNENISFKDRVLRAVDIRLAVKLAWQSAPGILLSIAPLKVLNGLLPLAGLYLMKLTIDAITEALRQPEPMSHFGGVVILIVATGAVGALSASLRGVTGYLTEVQGTLISDHVTALIQNKCIELDLEFFEDPEYYDALERAQKAGGQRPMAIIRNLTSLVQTSVTLMAMIGILISFNLILAGFLFIAAIPSVLVRMRFTDIRYLWHRERTEMTRLADAYNSIISGVRHAKEIRLYRLGDLFRERWLGFRKVLRGEMLAISRRMTIFGLLAGLGGAILLFGGLLWIARSTLLGAITLGSMVMYYQAFQRGLTNLRSFMMGFADLYAGNLFLSNLDEFFQQEPRLSRPPDPRTPDQHAQTELRFEGVSFRYPRSENLVLKNIDLSLAPDEIIALVGENGSGKTTMIKLLCRLYDPLAGRILLDGADIREFDLDALRSEISVIFQDFAQYPATVRENIWFGDLTKDPQGSEIEEAARRSGISNDVAELTTGYDTPLGRPFSGGEELSTGQWQKIALARAFLRDARIVVLDEPTSSMDARSEYDVFRHFKKLLNGRSAILVSHRFSTVRLADRIYVVEGGRIVEQGSHEELIQRGETYATMYSLQAEAFR